ncbi:efflux RND transporter periplasmic adaptor subunit [Thiohalocapsa marina]|uniref:efflux RND transporter periplasmic adaptor subunit n=1 Tax=Thiohalocapsa marina TaxID=424902 RepID=UPI0036DB6B5A
MRVAFKILLPILMIAVAVGVFRVLKSTRPEQEPPAVQERVWRVAVMAAEPRRLSPELELYGRVETPDLLKATAAANAFVAEVAVREGDRVDAGQVLVRLDPRDFLPRIAQVEAEVEDLQAQIASEQHRQEADRRALEQEQVLLQIARDAVARQQRLKTQNVGAEQALDEAEQAEALQALAVSNREMDMADHPSRLRALEARLSSARARLDALRLEYERSTVRAPYDGIVTGVAVTVGDQVSQGAVLARMFALDSLQVRARIPAPYQGELIRGGAENGGLQAVASVGDESLRLELDRLAGEADPSGVDGLFRVLDGADTLRLGQILSLRLKRPAREDAVAVPFGAVYGGDRLYKLQQGRLQGVNVETLGSRIGADGREQLLVRAEALQAGDPLVVTHLPNAMDGLRVEPVDAPAPLEASRP